MATHQQLPGTENLRQQHFRSGGPTRGRMSSKISSLHEGLVDLGQFKPSIRLKLSGHSSYKITLLPQWQDVRVTNVWLYVISALLQYISPISFSFATVRFKKILNHDIHYFCLFKSKLASHQIPLLSFKLFLCQVHNDDERLFLTTSSSCPVTPPTRNTGSIKISCC